MKFLQYTVWVKKIPPPEIFPKRLGIFSPNFTRLLYVPIYAGVLDYKFLFNYLQHWRSYAILSVTTIICPKCPPPMETHAGWSHLIWHNLVRVGENWITICILAYVWTSNWCVKCGLKIPLFGQNVRKCQRAFWPMVDILRTWCELGGHA